MNETFPSRVLVAINTLEVGGAERQILETCRSLGGREFRFDVVTTGEEGPLADDLRKAGARVHSLAVGGRSSGRAGRALRLALSIPRFRSLVKELRPNLVHSYLPEMSVVAAATRRRGGSPPLILSKRSLVRWIARDPFYFPLARWINRRADVILANSEAVRQDAIAKEGADPRRIRVIYNGVDAERYCPGPPEETLAREIGFPAGIPVIGMVANLSGYKGHADVLAAAAILRGQGLDFTLVFVGREGNASDAVRRQIAEAGLAERVRFAGTRPDIPRLLRLFDVFVSASHEEGFSNAVLEAMASGRAVVATSVGGTVEQIEDGKNGLLVKSEDPATLAMALGRLLRDPDSRLRLGTAARENVLERFSLQRLARQMASLYRETIRGGVTGAGNLPSSGTSS